MWRAGPDVFDVNAPLYIIRLAGTLDVSDGTQGQRCLGTNYQTARHKARSIFPDSCGNTGRLHLFFLRLLFLAGPRLGKHRAAHHCKSDRRGSFKSDSFEGKMETDRMAAFGFSVLMREWRRGMAFDPWHGSLYLSLSTVITLSPSPSSPPPLSLWTENQSCTAGFDQRSQAHLTLFRTAPSTITPTAPPAPFARRQR